MKHTSPKFHINPVEGFVIDRDELESLAYHLYLNRVVYEWDRFKYPNELVKSQDRFEYEQEGLRLNMIEPFLGTETMAKMKKIAEAQFLHSHTTGRLSNEEWTEFTGKPLLDPEAK